MAQLNIGDAAPNFEAVTDTDERVKLSDFQGKRVVLYFYPKDDTPGCTTQACGFRDNYPVIEERNAVILGVSPDDAESHRKFKSKFELPFTLLVDEDHAIADAYGAWGKKQAYGREYEGVIRSHFIIDEDGTIINAHYSVNPQESVDETLKILGE
jgi:thioredoxin-dependent peroxiredoxin